MFLPIFFSVAPLAIPISRNNATRLQAANPYTISHSQFFNQTPQVYHPIAELLSCQSATISGILVRSRMTAKFSIGFVICYLLFVICYLLFVICYLLFVICYSLLVICYSLFVICYLLFVIRYLLFVICYLLFVSQQSTVNSQQSTVSRGGAPVPALLT